MQHTLFPNTSLPDICLYLRGHYTGTHELPIGVTTQMVIDVLKHRLDTWIYPSDTIDTLVKLMCEQAIAYSEHKTSNYVQFRTVVVSPSQTMADI